MNRQQQPSLFDMPAAVVNTQPLARAGDRWTSHAAAAKLTRSGKRMSQKIRVLMALIEHGPATTAELAKAAGLDRYMVARRMPDLRQNEGEPDLVQPFCDPVKCTASGEWAQRWAATTAGLQVVQECKKFLGER